MALQIMTNINVDFYDKKYILINAKQYDDASRWIAITCYNQGSAFNLSASKHSAYIKYRKADGYGVLNSCKINYKGEVLVELTEQMLAADGICYVDLVIINKGSAMVNIETGEIIAIDDTPILSTMAFCVNVYETSVDNSEIDSSYEYNALNDLLQRAEAEYTEVIRLSKSYAVGNAGEIRDGEDTDNAKYYCEQSRISASAANTSALNAANSETLAEEHMQDALSYKNDAYTYMTNANTYMESAYTSEQNAKTSEINAAASEANAASSETNAANSEANALSYKEIVENINDSIVGSINTLASSGTVGSFIFMGDITFEELTSLPDDKKATGYVYCVTDDFVTDDSFVNGIGLSYTAGTNVYYTTSGWNCLGGSASPTATVDEVKSYLGI